MMKKERNSIKKGIIISVIICALVLVGILGSYAFFVSSGMNNPENIGTNTGTLALTFADGNPGINEALEFGSSVEKTFTIENTGTLNAIVNVYWKNLINTYKEGSLTYTFSYSENENGEYIDLITSSNIPRSDSPTNIVLAPDINIPSNTKYFYKLTITLNYLEDVDQTEDLNALLSTQFFIEEAPQTSIINFDATEGNCETTSKKVALNSTYGELPIPEKEGYIFAGWFTEKNGGAEITSDTIMDTLGDKTLYAHWEKDLTPSEKTLSKLDIQSNQGNPDFTRKATSDEGVYSMEDDYGTSYYFRGATTKNYVKFAGFYWRIIRINGDGSVRLIYDGQTAYSNSTSNSNRVVNTSIPWVDSYHEDVKYVGYMYGGTKEYSSTSKVQAQTNTTSSEIKIALENWYRTNITNKGYDEFVSDTLFCNDRSTRGINTTSYPYDSGLGYGQNQTEYGTASRLLLWKSSGAPVLKSNPEPTFKCPQKNDAFTKNDTSHGNGSSSEKVGLITADEVITAGGTWLEKNVYYYLYKGVNYWTMSPFLAWTSSVGLHPDMFYIDIDYTLNNKAYPEPVALAPVINLTSEYFLTLIGNGSASNPYRVKDDTL